MSINQLCGPPKKRAKEGFSLTTVLALSVVCALWLEALFSTVMPSYHQVSKARTDVVLRGAAEAAVDWAVQQLQVNGSSIDDLNALDQAAFTSSVPSDVFATMELPITAQVTVWSPRYGYPTSAPTAFSGVPQGSYLYDPNGLVGAGADPGWRLVRVTAKIGESGKNSKTIQVLLKPSTTTFPLFNEAMFSDKSTNFNGASNYIVDSYDSSAGTYGATRAWTDGDVASNGNTTSTTPVDLAGARIGGDVVVLSQPGASDTRIDVSGGSRVDGQVLVNGITTQSSGVSTFNIKTYGGTSTASGTYVHQSMNQPAKALPPVPAAPTTANGSNSTINDDTTLNPGDYVVNAISLSGNKKLVTNGTASNPVRIFVQGVNSSISVSGNASINNTGTPPALQIFYAGTDDVAVSGNGTFKGVVYAPNAKLKLNGNAEMFGAAIAGSITMNGGGHDGGFHYDRALANMNLLNSVVLAKRTTVSWQEVSN